MRRCPFDLGLCAGTRPLWVTCIPQCEHSYMIDLIISRADGCVFSGVCVHPGIHALERGHARLRRSSLVTVSEQRADDVEDSFPHRDIAVTTIRATPDG